jgi:hypothetical protein
MMQIIIGSDNKKIPINIRRFDNSVKLNLKYLIETIENKYQFDTNTKVTIIDSFFKRDNLESFNYILDLVSTSDSCTLEITNNNQYTFTLIISGKIIDAFSLYNQIDMSDDIVCLDKCLMADLDIYERVSVGRGNPNSYNNSIMFRILSEKNGNISYSNLYNILASSVGIIDGILLMLEGIYKSIYNVQPDRNVIANNEIDKLSLSSINPSVMDELYQLTIGKYNQQQTR